MFEIEVKAWLNDRHKAEEALARCATFTGITEKQDEYWGASVIPQENLCFPQQVRIRSQVFTPANESDTQTEIIITYKKKHIENGYEINDETEFSVSNAVTFARFLSDMGYSVTHRKKKNQLTGTHRSITLNLPKLKKSVSLLKLKHFHRLRKNILSPSADGNLQSCLNSAACRNRRLNRATIRK